MAIDINLTEQSDAELEATFKELQRRRDLKARLVTVLDRGQVGDRLHVDLPPGVYGEWISKDKMDIYRVQSMGFEIDNIYATKRALNDDTAAGAEGATVGDVIFMTCPREVKDLIDEIKKEQYQENNNPRRGKQKEERDFEHTAEAEGMPVQIKSRVDGVNADNIRNALTAVD